MGGISAAYKQAKLTENNVTERFWPKVNSRINYPINRAMNAFRNAIQDDDLFNLADPVFKYCVSWVIFMSQKMQLIILHHPGIITELQVLVDVYQ